MSKSGPECKSFQIPKELVWEAYGRVKANKGAAGVDGQSISDFEADLRRMLRAESPSGLFSEPQPSAEVRIWYTPED